MSKNRPATYENEVLGDFDVPRLTRKMIKEEIESFVPFCVFNYYLR